VPRETPPRSMMDVVAVMGGGDGGSDDVRVGVWTSRTGEESGRWGSAEQNGRVKRDMNSDRAML
jgi:hypothetical protein